MRLSERSFEIQSAQSLLRRTLTQESVVSREGRIHQPTPPEFCRRHRVRVLPLGGEIGFPESRFFCPIGVTPQADLGLHPMLLLEFGKLGFEGSYLFGVLGAEVDITTISIYIFFPRGIIKYYLV